MRGQRALRFPTRFMLVAATNPCPCGYAGAGDGRCTLRRGRAAPSPPAAERAAAGPDGPGGRRPAPRRPRRCARHRGRELGARARAGARGPRAPAAPAGRDRLRAATARWTPAPPSGCRGCDAAAEQELGRAYAGGLLSARGRHRVLRVARTIADLAARDGSAASDVLTALSLRQRRAPSRRWPRDRCGRACDACLARARLLARLAGHLDPRRRRRGRLLRARRRRADRRGRRGAGTRAGALAARRSLPSKRVRRRRRGSRWSAAARATRLALRRSCRSAGRAARTGALDLLSDAGPPCGRRGPRRLAVRHGRGPGARAGVWLAPG